MRQGREPAWAALIAPSLGSEAGARVDARYRVGATASEFAGERVRADLASSTPCSFAPHLSHAIGADLVAAIRRHEQSCAAAVEDRISGEGADARVGYLGR
jgi:hypothetical protein